MSDKSKLPTANDIALSVKCPACGAVPNEECVSTIGPLRQVSPHEERYKLAFAASIK